MLTTQTFQCCGQGRVHL